MTNRILNTIFKKRWHFCCLLFFVSCFQKDAPRAGASPRADQDSIAREKEIDAAFDSIYLDRRLIRTGDLILRTGRDFASETFRQMSVHDRTYSHCGIALVVHDSVVVFHAIGGSFNPDQQLRRDPLEVFCNPYENRGFAIYRYDLSPQAIPRLMDTVGQWYGRKIPFDLNFDLATDDRMYCAEFVYKAVTRATGDTVRLPVTVFAGRRFVTIDDLFLNPWCRAIRRVNFRIP